MTHVCLLGVIYARRRSMASQFSTSTHEEKASSLPGEARVVAGERRRSELTEKLGGNALREACRRGQRRRNSFDAGHPQMCLFRQPNEVRQNPHLVALALYLTEDDVAGRGGVAD